MADPTIPDLDGLNMDELNLDNLDLGDVGLEGMDFDLGAFDLGEVLGEVETRYVKPPLYVGKRRAPVMYERAAELARDIGPAIMAGERGVAWLSGNFIFGDFIEALLVETNEFCDELTISTLSLSPNNVDSLHNLIVGDYVGEINLVVSDYFYNHNRAALPYIYSQLDIGDKFQLAVAGTHTKVTLMRCGDRKIVLDGSANLRSSRSVERMAYVTDPVVYDADYEVHRLILDHYATIKKAPRAGALWDLITKEVA